MIPYDIDPSLHDHEPGSSVLEDGFSPPVQRPEPGPDAGAQDEAGPAGAARPLAR